MVLKKSKLVASLATTLSLESNILFKFFDLLDALEGILFDKLLEVFMFDFSSRKHLRK